MFPVKDGHIHNIKYTGRSKAVVLDNRDPLERGRIRVQHPTINSQIWIPYLRDPSTFSSPPIGSVVYVEADCGFHTHGVASGNLITGDDNSPDIPEAFQRDIPTNRGFFTPGGHLIELDDGVATLTTAPIDTNYTTQNKGIRITTSGGNKIQIAEDTTNNLEYILIEDPNGNNLKIDTSTNIITLTNSNNKIFELSNKQILGQGTEPMVLGETLYNMLNTFLNSLISGIIPGSPGQNAASLIAIQQAATTLQSSLPNFKSQNSSTD